MNVLTGSEWHVILRMNADEFWTKHVKIPVLIRKSELETIDLQ